MAQKIFVNHLLRTNHDWRKYHEQIDHANERDKMQERA